MKFGMLWGAPTFLNHSDKNCSYLIFDNLALYFIDFICKSSIERIIGKLETTTHFFDEYEIFFKSKQNYFQHTVRLRYYFISEI